MQETLLKIWFESTDLQKSSLSAKTATQKYWIFQVDKYLI
jgi:hypothetical protein